MSMRSRFVNSGDPSLRLESRTNPVTSRDSFDNPAGPTWLDADHDAGCYVRIAAGANERAEMQLEVFAELQPAVGVRKRQGAFNIVSDCFGAGVGQIVEREDDYVIANADSPVLPPIAEK